MIPTERLHEIAESRRISPSWGEVEAMAAELLAKRESMSLPGYQRIVDERDAARAEAKKYHDALVARHGGEPIALLSELDAARAEVERLAKQLAELRPKEDALPSWDELMARPELRSRFGTGCRIANAAHYARHDDPTLTVREFVKAPWKWRNIGQACTALINEAVQNWRAEQPNPAGGAS